VMKNLRIVDVSPWIRGEDQRRRLRAQHEVDRWWKAGRHGGGRTSFFNAKYAWKWYPSAGRRRRSWRTLM